MVKDVSVGRASLDMPGPELDTPDMEPAQDSARMHEGKTHFGRDFNQMVIQW